MRLVILSLLCGNNCHAGLIQIVNLKSVLHLSTLLYFYQSPQISDELCLQGNVTDPNVKTNIIYSIETHCLDYSIITLIVLFMITFRWTLSCISWISHNFPNSIYMIKAWLISGIFPVPGRMQSIITWGNCLQQIAKKFASLLIGFIIGDRCGTDIILKTVLHNCHIIDFL